MNWPQIINTNAHKAISIRYAASANQILSPMIGTSIETFKNGYCWSETQEPLSVVALAVWKPTRRDISTARYN